MLLEVVQHLDAEAVESCFEYKEAEVVHVLALGHY